MFVFVYGRFLRREGCQRVCSSHISINKHRRTRIQLWLHFRLKFPFQLTLLANFQQKESRMPKYRIYYFGRSAMEPLQPQRMQPHWSCESPDVLTVYNQHRARNLPALIHILYAVS
jgi:hypothetical protein